MKTEMKLRVLRRQLTCLRKQNKRLRAEAKDARAATHVIRWARRFVNHPGLWNAMQIERAIARLDSR